MRSVGVRWVIVCEELIVQKKGEVVILVGSKFYKSFDCSAHL